jgi:hypothetical protein
MSKFGEESHTNCPSPNVLVQAAKSGCKQADDKNPVPAIGCDVRSLANDNDREKFSAH